MYFSAQKIPGHFPRKVPVFLTPKNPVIPLLKYPLFLLLNTPVCLLPKYRVFLHQKYVSTNSCYALVFYKCISPDAEGKFWRLDRSFISFFPCVEKIIIMLFGIIVLKFNFRCDHSTSILKRTLRTRK